MAQHMWVSTFSLGKGLDLGNVPQNSAFYTKYYIILRAQQTLLEGIKKSIDTLLAKVDDTNRETLQSVRQLCDQLLAVKFGQLLATADAIVIRLRDLLKIDRLAPDVIKILMKMIRITVTITSFLASLQWGEGTRRAEQQSERRVRIRGDERHLVAVCRICDKEIRFEHFEEHTQSCLEAYKSRLEFQEIDAEIRQMERNMNDVFLDVEWPGASAAAVNVYLPMIHVSLILRRALEVEMRSYDAASELEALVSSFSSFKELELPSGVKGMLGNMIKWVTKKRAVAKKFEQAFISLRKTTDGACMTHMDIQPMICDFELIKRISSGAFARVFLARKKSTGDIFAIKVLPKDEMIQKNQVKRIFAERDILLRFRNPGIIKFCMFFDWSSMKTSRFFQANTQIILLLAKTICTLLWSTSLVVICTRSCRTWNHWTKVP